MAPADAQASRGLIRRAARDASLIAKRELVVAAVVPKLREAGQLAHVEGHMIGDGRSPASSPRENADDALLGIGVLAQIAADLLEAAGALLSGTNHYAGAALLRQVVEVEYLTWAFANNKRDAAAWLNSTEDDRRRMFKPFQLRDVSGGHFLSADYGHHCELGGHPVPRAIPLLANRDPVHSQLLLVDLILHAWRTTDNLAVWAEGHGATEVLVRADAVRKDFSRWGQGDPLYAWTERQRPSEP